MKLSIIICVYNERDTILEVLKRVQQADLDQGWTKEIIIVDNNSTDGTRELLRTITDKNVRIIYQSKNFGKGNSVRKAIPQCTGEFIITQDADLEYHPRHYRLLIQKAITENLDVVYGSRVLSGKRHRYYTINYLAVRILTFLTNLFFNANYTDVATNYKLVRASLLKSLKLTCSGFDLDFEISNKLAMATKKIGEVPIDFEPRTYEQGKKIRYTDGLRSLWVIFRNKFFLSD